MDAQHEQEGCQDDLETSGLSLHVRRVGVQVADPNRRAGVKVAVRMQTAHALVRGLLLTNSSIQVALPLSVVVPRSLDPSGRVTVVYSGSSVLGRGETSEVPEVKVRHDAHTTSATRGLMATR